MFGIDAQKTFEPSGLDVQQNLNKNLHNITGHQNESNSTALYDVAAQFFMNNYIHQSIMIEKKDFRVYERVKC